MSKPRPIKEPYIDPFSIENLCRSCLVPTECQYCGECAKTVECPHGNILNDGCNKCDIEGDLAFDSNRERG